VCYFNSAGSQLSQRSDDLSPERSISSRGFVLPAADSLMAWSGLATRDLRQGWSKCHRVERIQKHFRRQPRKLLNQDRSTCHLARAPALHNAKSLPLR